jgi:hypothetical protein
VKRLVAIVVLSTLATAVCVEGHIPLEKEYARSKYVATVRVISSTSEPDAADGYYLNGVNYRLQRLETLKGLPPETFTVFNENTSGRFDMDRGASYLVFVYREHGRLRIDNCGNSGRLESSSEVLATVRRLSKAQK